MLAIDGLYHRYAGASAPALDGVQLQAARGQVLGLLGPNGAGKTTLISHLSGALAPQRGQITVDGQPLAAVRARTPTRIGVAPQELAFYPPLTVMENLACFAAACGLRGARRAGRIAACLDFARLQPFADVRAEQLSGGLKRRLNLAIALLPEPELLLLDEPTVGVDPQSRAFVLDAIRALADAGTAVIYASHYMEEIEAIADRVLILDHGRVLRDGPLDALLAEGATVLTLRADGLSAERLQRWGQVEQGPDPWCLRLAAHQRPSAVLVALEAEGVDVRQAEFGRASLEQLFMALTHRALRD
ncbi:ABC transporter ATP-binding protein [Xenophilus arseniciresistens]|uniref:ABC transporter ATP-binding protein n=1 Tax=Xenophilus arseniciresistens TaxID=1283306 RepID=A0AAE3N729_9BURK|nr:ABC transporter ATP-binding protein [Xenophilus arseniciresistens]MDA7416356.1 ABC transporter ATP-binding protein [Xenophilus arseniciresistens]